MPLRSLAILAPLLLWLAVLPARAEVREISPRPGVTIRFIYVKAANPVASAVLYEGGTGDIGIFPNGSMKYEGFLSGGAGRFVQHGISVAIPDVPSNRRNFNGFRNTPEHAADNAALLDFLREQANVPAWIVGTSNGSLSAAWAATALKERGPDGIVLTASTTSGFLIAGQNSIWLAPLGEVKVPVLLVHHRQDACSNTPFSAMAEVVAALKSARKVELLPVEGGQSANPACLTGYHQFLGIEAKVTQDIAEWIRRQQAGP